MARHGIKTHHDDFIIAWVRDASSLSARAEPACGARLAQRPTGSSFGEAQRGAAVLDRLPSTRWA